MDGLGIFSFGSEIAKHLAKLKAASDKDKSCPPKNINDFDYGKILVPEFSGNVRESRWKIISNKQLNKLLKDKLLTTLTNWFLTK